MGQNGGIWLDNPRAKKFVQFEKIWFTVSWGLFLVSFLIMILGSMVLKAVQAVPQLVLDFVEGLVYVYLGYIVFLIGRIAHYFAKIRPLE